MSSIADFEIHSFAPSGLTFVANDGVLIPILQNVLTGPRAGVDWFAYYSKFVVSILVVAALLFPTFAILRDMDNGQ